MNVNGVGGGRRGGQGQGHGGCPGLCRMIGGARNQLLRSLIAQLVRGLVQQRAAAVGAGGRPRRPKRPTSSFMFYLRAIREEVAAMDSQQRKGKGWVAKEAGRRWRLLDDAAKQPYMDQGEIEKRRYEREMNIYRTMTRNNGQRVCVLVPVVAALH